MNSRLWMFLLCGGLVWLGSSCGTSEDDFTLSIRNPEPRQFLQGWVGIEVSVSAPSRVKELLVGIRTIGEKGESFKVLERKDKPPFVFDWDTHREQDGTHKIEVEALLRDGRVVVKTVEPLWIVNRTARLKFSECTTQPLIVRERVGLTVEWVDFMSFLPETPIDLFVQGKLHKRQETGPYKFEVDLKDFKHSDEIYFSAVAVKGIFRGATTVCSVHIDRQGPRVRYVYPSKSGEIVPQKFSVILEIEDDFGIGEVEIKIGDKSMGKLSGPPFQIPVDLVGFGHRKKISLKAFATDVAGNQAENPPTLEVEIDAEPPKVEVLSPQANRAFVASLSLQASIVDDAEVGRVDFYIEDEKGQRLDNLLHTTGKDNNDKIFKAEIQAPVSLYGAGKRSFVIVASDIHNNKTTVSVPMIFGCKNHTECPENDPPFRCLGNRCIVPHKIGDQCDHEFSCETPLVCHRGGLSWCASLKVGICRQPCPSTGCPRGYFCFSPQGGKPICFPGDACSPFTLNCGANTQCVPWGKESFLCLPYGKGGVGATCAPYSCSASKGCAEGLGCVPQSASSGRCYRLCDQVFPARDCSGVQRCRSFPLVDKSKNSMGYCL